MAAQPQGILMPNWLAQRASVLPQKRALIAGGTTWTFADLHRVATARAAFLAGLGLQGGDRVATLLRNGPRVAEVVQALIRLDAVLVPLNTRLAAAELAWQIDDAGPTLLLHDGATADLARSVGALVPAVRLIDISEPPSAAPSAVTSALRQHIDLAGLHSVIYTSGTTGRPKGALLTYGNHWWNAIGSALNLGTHDDDCWLAVLPLFHVGGLAILMRSVIYGVPAIIHEAFDPAAANRAIDEDGVTMVSVVATMLRRMLDERGERPYPARLRCVLLGGGPAPRTLLEECAARGVPVVQTYGLTETASQVVTLAPGDALRKLGSAGKPLLSAELRIVREGGEAARPGEAGEIAVRGPSVTAGYLHHPQATAQALRDGWLHTGDLGYLDAEGYLYVLDRRDDLIVSGGENVYPAEIEAALLSHPDVAEAGVTGMAHPLWGQVPVAAVVMRPASTTDDAALIDYCAARLARYKVPAAVRIVESLPRTAAGKLLRRVLREEWPAIARDGRL